jgi:hypothetical protein
VAYHRLVFRQGQKERLVRAASVMAIGGLAAGLITAFVAGLFGLLWFVFPPARRH